MNNCWAVDLVVPALILIYNLTNTATEDFQPMNVNFGLFPRFPGRIPKKLRGAT
jgi:folate-dependent tRNA-U54 methylase TrmFO/GidA